MLCVAPISETETCRKPASTTRVVEGLDCDLCAWHARVIDAESAGRAWAEREADALVDAPDRRWGGSALDARPLIDPAGLDPDGDELSDLADAANAAAAERWAELADACSVAAEFDAATRYAIAPGVVVNRARAEELADNCRHGDANVRLFVAPRVGGGMEVYLETSAGPSLVAEEEGSYACSVEQAAEALELTPCEVYDLVLGVFPECEWAVPEA